MQDVGAERVQGRAPPWHTPSPDILHVWGAIQSWLLRLHALTRPWQQQGPPVALRLHVLQCGAC